MHTSYILNYKIIQIVSHRPSQFKCSNCETCIVKSNACTNQHDIQAKEMSKSTIFEGTVCSDTFFSLFKKKR